METDLASGLDLPSRAFFAAQASEGPRWPTSAVFRNFPKPAIFRARFSRRFAMEIWEAPLGAMELVPLAPTSRRAGRQLN